MNGRELGILLVTQAGTQTRLAEAVGVSTAEMSRKLADQLAALNLLGSRYLDSRVKNNKEK